MGVVRRTRRASGFLLQMKAPYHNPIRDTVSKPLHPSGGLWLASPSRSLFLAVLIKSGFVL